MTWCPITGWCSSIGGPAKHIWWNPIDRDNYDAELMNSDVWRTNGGMGGPISSYATNLYPKNWYPGSTSNLINGSHYYYCTK